MMVVTASRLAAVRYYHEVKRYIEEKGYTNVDVLVAFSGAIKDGGDEHTEGSLTVGTRYRVTVHGQSILALAAE